MGVVKLESVPQYMLTQSVQILILVSLSNEQFPLGQMETHSSVLRRYFLSVKARHESTHYFEFPFVSFMVQNVSQGPEQTNFCISARAEQLPESQRALQRLLFSAYGIVSGHLSQQIKSESKYLY
ncbi:Hypothetical_protein [Hexamita inflata]|uniref:Hypothetical_protein n=1 Tax=Hexamita inflata TaxID=28002 RepID=A0AA86UWU0_9EUKA|nr:Hypothetical protein HINF_LOCUS62775 [Hexamita inflata]